MFISCYANTENVFYCLIVLQRFLTLRLLQYYCIALPLKDNTYLLPSLLSTKQPPIRMPQTDTWAFVHRLYKLAYLPPSFWPRLITRVQTFVINLYAEHKAVLESPREPQVTQWSEGIHVYWSDQAFFVICRGLIRPQQDTVQITTPKTKHGARILSHVVDHLDSLFEEWFSDLWCKCFRGFNFNSEAQMADADVKHAECESSIWMKIIEEV